MDRPFTIFRFCLFLGVLVNVCAIGSTIMEPDGALYASIAKTMVLRNDWVNLYAEGADWLDKPHFPFWAAAASFTVFGINSFAYKLPALIFWAIGGWYVWRYGNRFHNSTIAKLALLIYLSALHLLISNNDVRAEPYLTGMLIGCVYHFRRAMKDAWWQVVVGAFWLALAIMTKGIFIAVLAGLGFFVFWFMGSDQPNASRLRGAAAGRGWWGIIQQIRRRRWWAVPVLTAIFIFPEIWCLWKQFDAHPEKIIFGRSDVSGIRFFFWDSQFGRFMNNGPIKGKGDPFFFAHTLLWAFLPWSIWLYVAIGQWFGRRRRLDTLCMGVGLAGFVLFSASKFQLPHYMNIVFPFFALLVAQWLAEAMQPGAAGSIGNWGSNRLWAILRRLQVVVIVVMLLAAAVLWSLMHADGNWWVIGWILLGAWLVWLCFYGYLDNSLTDLALPRNLGRLVLGTYMAAITLYGFLNMYFYPVLLRYQSGTQAAAWLNQNLPDETIHILDPVSYSLDFYHKAPVEYDDFDSLIVKARLNPMLVYSSPETFDSLQDRRCRVQVVQRFAHFHVSRLQIGFLLPSKRPKYLQERMVAWVTAPSLLQGPVAGSPCSPAGYPLFPPFKFGIDDFPLADLGMFMGSPLPLVKTGNDVRMRRGHIAGLRGISTQVE
ncbi:putative glycosyltransferase [Flavihumibacter petaseus NBRC 106054]|uniref:Putative glycosyltransferase n=1 Tax=Flavihumibacter petaseus NBRC 106054 TaxID=1220578 RepID=A0A0E9MZE2_9BACT|nr:putative glycosyltransferase [Flavihumibacter petaseus NBRC 106054]